MATPKQLPSGSWRVRVYIGKDRNGNKKYKSITAESKKEANRQAALYEYQEEKRQADGITIGELLSLYVETCSHKLSPASIRKYESMRKNNFGSIEDRPIRELKQIDYQRFANDLAAVLSPKSVASICGLLTAAIKAYDPSLVPVIKRPSPHEDEFIIPNDQQVKSFIASAGSPEMECAFALGAILGLRRSEIAPLTWKDIDGHMLHINKAMVQDKNNKWITKSTKTTAGTRTLELPDYLERKIISLKPDGAKPEDRIFSFTPSAITMRFMKVSKSVGFRCRFHDLRHYNASVMLALEIPDKYAMKRMGHATPHMLKTVYQHTMGSKEKEVTDKMNKYMRKIAQKQEQKLSHSP